MFEAARELKERQVHKVSIQVWTVEFAKSEISTDRFKKKYMYIYIYKQ